MTEILYLVETTGWVQHKRVEYLTRHQNRYSFKVMTVARFRWLWRFGLMRNRPVVFSSWRTLHNLLKKSPNLFSDAHMQHFLGAVTSHSNIGGGLDPLNPIPGRTPEEAYRLSTDILSRFKVVTVNSMILKELLEPALPGVLYCPNGVDDDFFRPAPSRKPLNPSSIRVGWVGKERGPKNFAALDEALRIVAAEGGIEPCLIRVDKAFKNAPYTPEEMRAFYQNIDFYLCASWNEGTPNPGLEAAACGVPVISTMVGNMRELIREGETGWFVEPTVDSMVDRLRHLKTVTPADYVSMSAAARKSIETDWSWRQRVGNFTAAYDALTGRQNQGVDY